MKALLVIIMSLCLHVTYAQKPDTTKTFIQGKDLGEVVRNDSPGLISKKKLPKRWE